MTAPGVEVRPIRLINGTSPFCETFFTDVKVPKDQLFGPLNGGWTVAKRLLQFERDNISAGLGGGNIGQATPLPTVVEAARDYVGVDETGALADRDLRRRITDHRWRPRFQLTVRRAATGRRSEGPTSAHLDHEYAGEDRPGRNELWSRPWAASGWGGKAKLFSARDHGAAHHAAFKGNSIEAALRNQSERRFKRVLGLPDEMALTPQRRPTSVLVCLTYLKK